MPAAPKRRRVRSPLFEGMCCSPLFDGVCCSPLTEARVIEAKTLACASGGQVPCTLAACARQLNDSAADDRTLKTARRLKEFGEHGYDY